MQVIERKRRRLQEMEGGLPRGNYEDSKVKQILVKYIANLRRSVRT